MSEMSHANVNSQGTTDRLSEFFTPIADTITSTVMGELGGVNAVSSSPTVQVPYNFRLTCKTDNHPPRPPWRPSALPGGLSQAASVWVTSRRFELTENRHAPA